MDTSFDRDRFSNFDIIKCESIIPVEGTHSVFLQLIFTWWNRQTIGTFIYTLLTGKFVGYDEFGNKYYSNSKGKRWVIYKSKVESSKIPPEWHLWIHFLIQNKPSENINKFIWQKKYE